MGERDPAVGQLHQSGPDRRLEVVDGQPSVLGPHDRLVREVAEQPLVRGHDAGVTGYRMAERIEDSLERADQALVPIKTIAFDEAVNVTLGLPFVRTSPDHGTAFDIAGKGVARPNSLIAALRLAARLGAKAAPPVAA